jgi:hypothetical protein
MRKWLAVEPAVEIAKVCNGGKRTLGRLRIHFRMKAATRVRKPPGPLEIVRSL